MSNVQITYTFAMPNYIYVQMKNVEKPARIEADSVTEDKAKLRLIAKKGDKVVGDIDQTCVMGWWTNFE